MTILDIVILCLMVLAGLWGFIRGGKRKLVKWVALIGGLAVGIYFYSMLGNWIAGLCGDSLANTFADKIISSTDSAEKLIVLNSPYQLLAADEAGLKEVFTAAGIPSFFVSFFATKVFITDGTVALAVGSSFAASVIYAGCFVGLFLVTFIILKLLTRLLLGMGADGKKKTILDRLMGVIFSEAKLLVFLVVIMLILVGISYAVPSLQTWLTEQTRFNEGVVGLSGWFYNIAWQIINAFKMLVA